MMYKSTSIVKGNHSFTSVLIELHPICVCGYKRLNVLLISCVHLVLCFVYMCIFVYNTLKVKITVFNFVVFHFLNGVHPVVNFPL